MRGVDVILTMCMVRAVWLSFPMQTVEKLVKQRNVFEFLCKDFRMVRLRMEFDPKRTAEENEAVWKQAYYAFVAYVELV